MFVSQKKSKINTEGGTLVVPAVSIGNVPQLAVDLLINTLRAPRIGVIDSPALTPISGPAGYDHLDADMRSMPLEIYQSEDEKWTIIQQRAPPLPKHHRIFARELVEYIKSSGFARVVVLASSDAALRTDALIDGSQIRTLSVNMTDGDLAQRLQDMSLGEQFGYTKDGSGLSKSLKQLHSAGVTRPLLELCDQAGISALSFISLVNEGDNIPDAISLANTVNTALGIAASDKIGQWVPPKSWQWLMPTNIPEELF
ncbi:hypothetical protein GGI15_000384 [Coemansia interrupta]|uniref:Proteasome assembly chaperone 2 n=1 Tax=Coemansia interrupta TaxID=1126814 RepID=A0A9W8HNB8_9FUNG|nr:hypothetical protein GGI15_000384 [Coemansia interrupta]